MAKYAISSSGESSMRQLANDIKSFSTSNLEAGRRLKQATLSVEDGLGIYLEDILEIIAQTQNSVVQSSESLETLAQKVMQKADAISELVAMGLGGKASGVTSLGQSSQNVLWSDAEYCDVADKIQIADRNSDILEWNGEKGNSLRTPKDKSGELYQQLSSFGVLGIPYVNGDVDFSQVSKYEVEFSNAEKLYRDLGTTITFGDLMTDNAMKSRSDFNKKIRYEWQKMAKQQIVDRIVSDNQFERNLSAQTGLNTHVIKNVSNLDSELTRCGLTLHETTDCKRIQFVPTKIHDAFKHAGGTAEMLERLLSGDIHFKVGV